MITSPSNRDKKGGAHEPEKGFAADPADRFDVTQLRNAYHQCAKNERRDDHLDQRQEYVIGNDAETPRKAVDVCRCTIIMDPKTQQHPGDYSKRIHPVRLIFGI